MTRVRDGIVRRLLHVDTSPVIVHVWRRHDGTVRFRSTPAADGVERGALEVAIERMRFALGVDDDLREFYDTFRRDRRLGPLIRRRPWVRPKRNAWPWEAFAWAVTKQLIESPRAAKIQRRIVWRWGPELDGLRDIPDAAAIAGVAPAELASMDLAPSRALSLIKAARDVAGGRCDLRLVDAERRLLAIPGIGTWTVRCLGLFGRGDPDALPSGDLGYVKLIGRLAGLGRRATVEEVEEFFAPYEPFRGLAGTFMLANHKALVAAEAPVRRAA
ncbi:MAG: DNA-3-methyladenine glycosylase family protein [Solirubrobacterales bacterium]